MTADNSVQFTDDQSLQRFGANLPSVALGADEVAKAYAAADALKGQFTDALRKMTSQAETDLPASPALLADMQAVSSKANTASDGDAWRAVATHADQLPGTYRREHETDEDRLHASRGSRRQEMRADVTAAVQDN